MWCFHTKCACACSVALSCPTLCDTMDCSPPGSPMDCSPPGFSVHGILQARILEWVAVPFFRESSCPKDRIQASRIAGEFFTIWATREALPYPLDNPVIYQVASCSFSSTWSSQLTTELQKPDSVVLRASFVFNWRIIALQCCVCFCHTTTWISHMYTYVLPLLNLPPTTAPIPPLKIVLEHQVELAVLYSSFPLTFYFTMLLSQFVPPSPSCSVSTSLFSMSLSLFLPCK